MLSPTAYGAAIILSLALVYRFLVYPIFLSPLAKIPNAHWSCSFSPLWLLWMKWTNQENRTIYQRHMESGPCLRLTPTTLSLNCFEDGVKKVYQGGFPKPVFYFRGFAIYGTENIFTFEDNATHSTRKRLISNTFSKSYILASRTARAATRDVLFGRFLPMLHRAATAGSPLEVLALNYSYSMDTFVQWQYGKTLASNFVENEEERKMYLDGFFAPYHFLFWMYNFPDFASLLRKIGIFLIPRWVDLAFKNIEDWNLDKCDKAQQLLASNQELSPEDTPVVFERAMKTMSDVNAGPKSYPRRMEIASDMFAHNSAAFETSGNTETFLMYEMSRNPAWQKRVRDEVASAFPNWKFDAEHRVGIDDVPDPKVMDNLPIVNAVLQETLRLYPSVPGGQPRVVPSPCSLGGYDNIPRGTTVQSYAYSLHRNPEVFPDPHDWNPQRWLDASPEELATMKRWFWAFGSGARMCIGSNFAYYSMKFLVSSVYRNFTTTIHDAGKEGDMDLLDSYLAGPKGHKLVLKFHHVNE